MKKIILILFLFIPLGSFAQTDRELLLKLVEQQAIHNTKMEGMQKQMEGMQKQIEGLQKQMDVRFESIDKRFESQTNYIIAIIGLFGVLIAVIVWDRRTVTRPFESKTEQLEKANEKLQQEIEILKAKEMKTEQLFKGFAEIDPRFAEIFRNASVL
jgi:predicted  nucleic acid-binding Zn-ribbon protein